jgi:hypothetical protein
MEELQNNPKVYKHVIRTIQTMILNDALKWHDSPRARSAMRKHFELTDKYIS